MLFRSGFCMKHNELVKMPDGNYHVKIDAEKIDGEMNYGNLILPGKSKKEIFISSYICHPSLANDNLSGVIALVLLYNRIKNWNNRKYSYRFLLNPETIGSIAYLAKYGDELKSNVFSGFVLTCLGGKNDKLSFKMSRNEDAILNSIVTNLKDKLGGIEIREFTPISGSDERQFCSPGFNLPIGQIARTPYLEFKEYHTSLDDKEYMDLDKVIESVDKIEKILIAVENSKKYINLFPYGEPQLGRRGLYRSVNSSATRNQGKEMQDKIRWILSYSDGINSVEDVAKKAGCKVEELNEAMQVLLDAGLIKEDF